METPSSFVSMMGEQLGLEVDVLPWPLVHGAIRNIAYSILVLAISQVISPALWADLPRHKHKIWHTTFLALVNSVMITPIVVPVMFDVLQWVLADPSRQVFEMATTSDIYYVTGFLLGYMLIDTLCMVIWWTDIMSYMKKPMFIQMWIHHLLSLVLWPYALCCHRTVICVAFYVFTEASNPFLNTQALIDMHPVLSKNYLVQVGSKLVFFFTFFVVRILPTPFFLVAFALPYQY